MIELARPWALLALPLPLLAWWLLPALGARAVLPVPAGVRDLLLDPTAANPTRRWPPGLLPRVLGWCALVIAIAGPQTPAESLMRPTGRDVLVAVDLSSSMDESDMRHGGQPAARYAVVRDLLGQFIASRRGDRVGLIAFGHEAFLIAPLSFDGHAVATTLAELEIGLPGHRTDLGRAVGLAVQTLRVEPAGERVLVLLSDGEDNTGALTGHDAAVLAAQYDIRIHSIGFSPALDADGAAVLERIASATGGEYFAAQSTGSLASITEQIGQIEPVATENSGLRLMHDWSHLAIFVAVFAIAAITLTELRQA